MTEQQKLEKAEAFVRKVTTEVFKQKLDAETLRQTARQVARALPITSKEKEAA